MSELQTIMKFRALHVLPAMRLLLLLLGLALPAGCHKVISGNNSTHRFLSLDNRDYQTAGGGHGFFLSLHRSLIGEGVTNLECNNNFVPNDDVSKVMKESGDEAAMLEDDRCFTPDVKRESIDSCLSVADASKPAVYIVGDSHASVLQQGLKESMNWQLGYVAYANGRLPNEIDAILEGLNKVVKPGDVVIWAENFVVLDVSDYQNHIEKLKSLTLKTTVMLLGDVPSLPEDPELCMLRAASCMKTRVEVENQRKPFIDAIARASEQSANKIWAMNLQPEFCTADECSMYITGTKTLGFMDRDHVNREASNYLGYKICTQIQKKLKDRGEASQARRASVTSPPRKGAPWPRTSYHDVIAELVSRGRSWLH